MCERANARGREPAQLPEPPVGHRPAGSNVELARDTGDERDDQDREQRLYDPELAGRRQRAPQRRRVGECWVLAEDRPQRRSLCLPEPQRAPAATGDPASDLRPEPHQANGHRAGRQQQRENDEAVRLARGCAHASLSDPPALFTTSTQKEVSSRRAAKGLCATSTSLRTLWREIIWRPALARRASSTIPASTEFCRRRREAEVRRARSGARSERQEADLAAVGFAKSERRPRRESVATVPIATYAAVDSQPVIALRHWSGGVRAAANRRALVAELSMRRRGSARA